jgi:phosphomannomutase
MSEINEKIFKAYDIRGKYPEEINEEAVKKISLAFLKFLSKEKKGSLKIVLGRDNRLSSKNLYKAALAGFKNFGAKIIDLGLVPTPVFYFAVWQLKADGGIQITASHNPPSDNGLKIVGKNALEIGKDNGLEEIKNIAKSIDFSNNKKKLVIFKNKSIFKKFFVFNFKKSKIKLKKKLTIVFDTANAVSGLYIPQIKKYLPGKIYHLFSKLDGSFPNHSPNPLEEKNLEVLKNTVLEKKADLGVAFDGDGDRIIFVSNKGEIIPSDIIASLIAKNLLSKNKGIKVVYNICSSNIIPETVKELGGIPIVTKIGHTFVKDVMRREKAEFGAEFSGHFYFKEFDYSEAPIFVLIKILEIIEKEEKPISEIILPFKKYFNSGQINFETEDKNSKIEFLKEKYKNGKISTLDGLRVDFPNWWFIVRPSNTENLLRLNVEAKTKELLEEKIQEIKNLILS